MNHDARVGTRRGAFELVRTFTGQLAVLDHDTREVMHPVVGPVRESAALYAEPSGLAGRLATPPYDVPLVLYDVGLGAGSNAACALKLACALPMPRRPLVIHSFDRTTDALRLALDAPEALGLDDLCASAAVTLLQDGLVTRDGVTWTFLAGRAPRDAGGPSGGRGRGVLGPVLAASLAGAVGSGCPRRAARAL